VLTTSRRETTATVTLSYLADDFDWAANDVATLTPDRRALDLTAWITLANGNDVSLLDAGTQIVAGRLNRVGDNGDEGEGAPQVIANCWPQGTTSSGLRPPEMIVEAADAAPAPTALAARTMVAEMVVSANRPPPPEQLGDLKLYRLGQRTTVAAHQSKQVLMLDQAAVPFTRITGADLYAGGQGGFMPATTILRTKNDVADHLGLPLPAGHLALFDHMGGQELLAGQTDVRDTAVGEDVEFKIGVDPDVHVRQTQLTYTADAPELSFLTPELLLVLHKGRAVEQVEIVNAGPAPAAFELRLQTFGSLHVSDADQPMGMKDGRPIFRLTVPANGSIKLLYALGGP
jgi:hypothetical protein